MRKKMLLASLLVSGATFAQTSVSPVVIKTPNEFRIIAASGNGKWACGVYADASDERYAFRWNLESGEVELLNPAYPSVAYSVSDDGVVVGQFSDHTYKSNGASVTLAGYWANNQWNRLEVPSGVSHGNAYSISPDGHYITGVATIDGVYHGYIWKDGKIERELQRHNKIAMPYAVSPDGQYAAGWVQDDNRACCIWDANGDFEYLNQSYQTPFSAGKRFSHDGNKLLYFGGWEDVDGDSRLQSIYDIATKEKSYIPYINKNEDFDVFDISDNGTVVGESGGLGFIYQNGESVYANNYLASKGVDLSEQHIFVSPDIPDVYQITRAASVSADDNVMGFQYYNDDKDESGSYSISLQSMVVKFNQPTTGLCPASVKASQLSGLSSVKVSWKPNVAAQDITGYNVYRDGAKVNTELLTNTMFVDNNVAVGEHRYTVTAQYGANESDKSSEAVLNVAAHTLSAPQSLFAKQHGYNSAYMEWSNPATNFGSLTYLNPDDANMETFGLSVDGISYETAIYYDKATLSAYNGQKITSVGFYPLENQGGWKVNLYTYDEAGKLKKFYTQDVTQTLDCGKRNVVMLTTPQDVPSGDLIVALEVAVTEPSQSINAYDNGRGVNGYSDLLRLTTDDDFYSFGELMLAQNYLNSISWGIDATVSPVGADLTKDNIANYNVYLDGKKIGSTTDANYIARNLSTGDHTVGVSAVYANGSESAQLTNTLTVTPDETQLRAVNNVAVDPATPSSVKATWTAPRDHDRVQVQYCSDDASDQGVVGPSENNYGIMAGAIYPSKTFRGRDGYKIRSVRFYPLSDATFTAIIYKNNVQIAEVEVLDYTLGKWNEVALDEPIVIDSKASYQLVIDCYDVTPKMPPLAVDNNAAVSGYSDIYSLDGTSWNPISSSAVFGNWMIGLNIESSTLTPLPVDGYDVLIDGVKKNTSLVEETAYTHDFGTDDKQQHTIRVDVHYAAKAEAVQGSVTKFLIAVSGINDNVVSDITLRQGSNLLTVEGEGVTSVSLVSVSGATIAVAEGNTVSLDCVAEGVYVVKAVVAGETMTRKVVVKK